MRTRHLDPLRHTVVSYTSACLAPLHIVGLVLCLLACLAAAMPLPHARAAAPSGKRTGLSAPFTRLAEQDPLSAVLIDFAQAQGYHAVVMAGVEGVVSGRFDGVPPRQFLAGAIMREVDARGLEDWDPLLAAKAIRQAREVFTALGDTEIRRAVALNSRLVRLAPGLVEGL